jgi:hypothetical protein
LTITEDGRETHIFTVFKRSTRFRRPRPWRLNRISSGGVEDFRSRSAAMRWAEICLSSDVEIRQ